MLIQDIKPYPSYLQAHVARIQWQASQLQSKRIKIAYIKPVELRTATMFPDLRAFKYEPTEDDYIQDASIAAYEG